MLTGQPTPPTAMATRPLVVALFVSPLAHVTNLFTCHTVILCRCLPAVSLPEAVLCSFLEGGEVEESSITAIYNWHGYIEIDTLPSFQVEDGEGEKHGQDEGRMPLFPRPPPSCLSFPLVHALHQQGAGDATVFSVKLRDSQREAECKDPGLFLLLHTEQW